MRKVSLSQAGKTPRILLSRTDALGDLILCTPTFRALRAEFPGAHIAVMCRSYAAPALEGNPAINCTIEIESETNANRDELAKRLQSEDYDIALALYPSSFAADVLRRARIPVRIGSARRFHSWKFTHRISHSRKVNTRSEAACNLDLLAPLGIAPGDITPEVFVSVAEIEQMRIRLRDLGFDSPFVALHPGSGGSALDWPLNKFFRLADQLSQRGIRSILTGGAEEAKSIADQCENHDIVSLAGRTTLRDLAALQSLADVVVANSTGPLHLAAAVGTDTIALFPPAQSMSPARWAPPVDNTTIITPDLCACDCRNGLCQRANSDGPCMDTIAVETVLEKLLERMKVLQAH